MVEPWRTFEPDRTIVVREQWRDRLWSAVPHRVVRSDDETLVSWVPTGAVAVWSSNRDLPPAAGLSREERKLLALQTCEVHPVERPEAPDKLFFHRRDRWSRVNLGWDPRTGSFNGWYVNFERPPAADDDGITSMDLVIDIWVDPDRSWRWKDRDDFDRAISDGIHPPEVRPMIEAEATRVIAEIDRASGPFAPEWADFHADPAAGLPTLPDRYRHDGTEWSRSLEERWR